MPATAIGIAWYRKDQYARLRTLFEDGHKLPNTYAAWLRKAEQGFKDLLAQGHTVHKVTVDIDEFPVWCARHGQQLNGKGRLAFVNYRVAEMLRGGAPS